MASEYILELLQKRRHTQEELRVLIASFRTAYEAMERLGPRYEIAAEAVFRDLSAFEARLEHLAVQWTPKASARNK